MKRAARRGAAAAHCARGAHAVAPSGETGTTTSGRAGERSNMPEAVAGLPS